MSGILGEWLIITREIQILPVRFVVRQSTDDPWRYGVDEYSVARNVTGKQIEKKRRALSVEHLFLQAQIKRRAVGPVQINIGLASNMGGKARKTKSKHSGH